MNTAATCAHPAINPVLRPGATPTKQRLVRLVVTGLPDTASRDLARHLTADEWPGLPSELALTVLAATI